MIRIIFSKSSYRCAISRSDALSDKFVSSLSTVTFILPRRIDEFSSRFSRYCPIEGDRGMGSGEDGRFIAFSKESCTLFSRKERNNVPYPFHCTMVSISSLIRVVCYFVSNAWITQIVRVVQACTKRLKMEKIRNCNRKWISSLRL